MPDKVTVQVQLSPDSICRVIPHLSNETLAELLLCIESPLLSETERILVDEAAWRIRRGTLLSRHKLAPLCHICGHTMLKVMKHALECANPRCLDARRNVEELAELLHPNAAEPDLSEKGGR